MDDERTARCLRCGRGFADDIRPFPALCPGCRNREARRGLPVHPAWADPRELDRIVAAARGPAKDRKG